MEINWMAILLASLSTLVLGFIWYNPKVFGNIWMKEAGLTLESLKGANMFKMLAGSFIYAFLMSIVLQFLVIHQWGVYSSQLNIKDVDPTIYKNFMDAFGHTYRTFKHGAFHGFISGLFLALPLIGTNALYERRSFKYVLVTGGFWIVSFMIMGGIICMMQ